MDNILDSIAQIQRRDMEKVFQAALERYRQLFPEYDICVVSLSKKESREEKIDQYIEVLNNMKKNGQSG